LDSILHEEHGLNWPAWIAIGVMVGVLYALARNWAGPDFILLAGAAVLMTLGAFYPEKFPSPRQMAGEFGNEGLLTVAALYVVAAGLTETGGISLATERLFGQPKTISGAQAKMMLPVVPISAFLSNTAVVAMFIPVLQEWCRKARISPSKLFLPLSYMAILGGVCTLIGTSTNLVVQGLMIEAQKTNPSMPRMGFWTIGAVGLPCTIAGGLFILITSRWLLKDRSAPAIQAADPRQYTVEMLVQPGSGIDGRTIEQAGLRHLPGTYLAEIQRDGQTLAAVAPEQVLHGDDRLIFVGVVESVVDLQKFRGLIPATDQVFKLAEPRHDRALIEAVVSNTCPLVGKSIREGRFRSRYEAAVIAVHRSGQRINSKIGDIVLQAGDTLLLESHPRFHRIHRDNRDFFLVSKVPDFQPPRHHKAWISLGILAAMVIAMSFERYFSVFNSALIAAGLMLATRCVSGERARRSVDFSTLVAIGASFGIGKALESTGATSILSTQVIHAFHPFGSWGALAGVYLVTLILTEFVANNAAAALAFPIAKAVALDLGVHFMPFAIVVAVAASAGFAVPIGYQTHLMVYGPGGYRLSDFLRVGLPLDLLIMVVAVALTPVWFPF
jgi:di/tricarboxylate transporter